MRGSAVLERAVVCFAALVCLLFVAGLRDTPSRAVWRPQNEAPSLPESVGERDAALLVTVTDAEGNPEEGALVRVFVVIDDVVYLAKEGVTGPDGKVRLDGLPQGEAWVVAEREGRARKSARLVLEPGVRPLELRLEAAESFEVVVVDPMQRPIRGVDVSLYSSDPLAHRQLTDERGLARFVSLPAPPYAVEVVASGFDSKLISKLTLADSPLFVKLSRLGGLEVIVLGPDGKPDQGATVLVAGSALWPARSAETNAEGRVSITGLAHGFYDVRAEHGNLISDTAAGVLLGEGEIKEVELGLIAGSYVTVLVTDGEAPDAPPIPDADVALVERGVSSFPRYGRTGADGKAVLGPLAGQEAVASARADGYVARSAVPVEEGQSEVQVPLLRGGVIRGEVVDERDFPVDGAQLEVVGVDIDGMPIIESSNIAGFREDHFDFALPGAVPLVPAGELGVMPIIPDIPFESRGGVVVARRQRTGDPWVSGRDGTFVLSPVTPGEVHVVARHPSFVEGISAALELAPGGEQFVRIVLRRGGVLEGRVVEVGGTPIGGARVEIVAVVGSLERITFTADDGTFAFAAVPDEIVLSVARPESLEEIAARISMHVPPDERREIEIVLSEPREGVSIEVTDEAGYPVGRAEVQVSSLEPGTPLVRTLFTSEEGEAELPGGRGLPLRFVVRRRGYAPGAVEIDGAPADVELVIGPAYTVIGEIHGRPGAIADAQLTLVTPTGARAALSDGDGAFRIVDVAPGGPRLLVVAPGHVPTEIDVVVDGPPSREVDLGRIELAEAATVSGTVVDENGDPIAGARVALGRVPTFLPLGDLPVGITATDRRGRFTLTGVPEGEAVLEAYSRGYARSQVSVRVRAGDTEEGVELQLAEDPDADVTHVGASASLGVTLGEHDGRVIIFEHVPLQGEAHYAGILPGDRFFACNGFPIRSLEQARARLNGPLSEDMVIEIERESGARWRLRVRRERIR